MKETPIDPLIPMYFVKITEAGSQKISRFALKEKDGTRMCIMQVSPVIAEIIASYLTGVYPEGTALHDIMLNITGFLGITIQKVVVAKFENDHYYANLHLKDKNGTELNMIDFEPPSSAIALCLRAGCPIFINDELLFEDKEFLDAYTKALNPANTDSAQTKTLENMTDQEMLAYLQSLDPDKIHKA